MYRTPANRDLILLGSFLFKKKITYFILIGLQLKITATHLPLEFVVSIYILIGYLRKPDRKAKDAR